jgi:hypothetical protein
VGFDRYTMQDVWKLPPYQSATQSTSTQRIVACTPATASVALVGDILAVNSVPQQAASSLGELPASGPTLVEFYADSGDIWILFGPNVNVVVDPTATTAAKYGALLKAGVRPAERWMLNPKDHAYFSARTGPGGATLYYRAVGPSANNRP